VIVLVILAVVAVLAARRAGGRRNLGPEYARLADEAGTREANAEWARRRRRVDRLGIRPLSPERRALYTTQWVAAQEEFINSPVESARTAAALVTAVAGDRGYEVADSGQLLTDLSAYYGNQLDGYRRALAVTAEAGDTAAGQLSDAATEELRRALLGYRAMFRELAQVSDSDEAATVTAPGRVPAQPGNTAPAATQYERTGTHGTATR
jgi:hypothetical protein